MKDVEKIIEVLTSVPEQRYEKMPTKELHDYIVSCILCSKFRRTRVDDETIAIINNKVSNAIIKECPIEFSIPFGAYKGWKLPTYPETDWAEVFNINYIINYLLPITKVYRQGIIVYYTYQDNVMHKISNIPKANFSTYKKCFQKLINYYNSIVKGIKFEMFPINDLYHSDDAYQKDYEVGVEYNLLHWEEKYTEEERNKKISSARNNLARKGVIDYSGLNEEQWEQRCVISAMQTDAVDCLYWRRKFNKESERIQLVFVRGPKNSIHIGSCSTSTAHFWAGIGVLENNNKLLPRILTQNQYLSISSEKRLKNFKCKNILIDISKNYQNIQIIN